MTTLDRRALGLAIAASIASLSLSACGGGGNGNTRPDTSGTSQVDDCTTHPSQCVAPPAPPAPPPPIAPPPPPAPPSFDPRRAQIDATHVGDVQAQGYRGQGVKIGILDTGADTSNPALAGRIAWSRKYPSDSLASPAKGDVYGHGSVMAQLIGGMATDGFAGGVAPESSLYMARVAADTGAFQPQLFANAFQDLLGQGVKLFNNSYATHDAVTAPDKGQAFYQGVYAPVVAAGGLLVFATGNDGVAQPSVQAGLPYVDASLEKGWLAVANLALDANGGPNGLDASSNACGVAARWCLVAPGRDYFVPVAGTGFNGGVTSGTSSSAAVVTGIAALVWQKFPYFSADNVRQTLLGTATSLGDPSLYGYGLVNAAKALNGPGLFDWGDFDVTTDGSTSAWSNDIGGNGRLLKHGAGTLILSGNNTYSGGSVVDGGELRVDGRLGSDVTVDTGGLLSGSGTIAAHVLSQGAVRPLATSFLIGGSYTATASSVTQVSIGTPLHVGGVATLQGGELQLLAPASGYVVGTSERVLRADGGVQGQFGQVGYGEQVFYSATLNYTPNDVIADLSRQNVAATVTAMGVPSPTAATARRVESALSAADGWAAQNDGSHQAFLDAAGQFLQASPASAAASVDSLSGEIHASSQAVVLQQSALTHRLLGDRLGQVLNAPQGEGAWFQALGANGNLSQAGYARAAYTLGGGMAGLDRRIDEHQAFGISVDWSRIQSDFARLAGRDVARSSGFSLYGRTGNERWYLSGSIGQHWIRSDVDRSALLGATTQAIGSTRDDQLTSAYIESGLDFRSDNRVLTPFVALGIDRLRRGAIREQGAGGFGLDASAATINQGSAYLGLRAQFAMDWAGGHTNLQAYGLWQHLLSGRDYGFDANFAAVPGELFRVQGIAGRGDLGWVGINAYTQVNRRWGWMFDAAVQGDGRGVSGKMVGLGLRLAW